MNTQNAAAQQYVVDTVPALKALMEEVGTTYRECARIFGTGHSPLCKAINRKGRRPTLDTLVRWAANAREEVGIEMSFLITPEQTLKWQIKKVQ